ncbi:MAG: hypothetical protein IPM82_19285 [Saprospiraceae bacterium]|nr:hypothetical protein [Saprospiraceae bacterium]
MAYTSISKATLPSPIKNDMNAPYFHLQDILNVMNQGAIAVQLIQVTIKNVKLFALVGVKKIAVVNGLETATEWLETQENILAVGCPPLNKTGGQLLLDPTPIVP